MVRFPRFQFSFASVLASLELPRGQRTYVESVAQGQGGIGWWRRGGLCKKNF